jgi:membrane-associated phospholipid phosphatase
MARLSVSASKCGEKGQPVQSSTISAQQNAALRGSESARGLRVSEKLVLGFFVYAVLASVIYPLSSRERLAVLALNLGSSAVICSLSRFGTGGKTDFLSLIRDWFPCVLILLTYRESGLFFIPDPTHRLDYLFAGWDSGLLKSSFMLGVLSWGSPWIQRYLEFAYFLCYPLVPLGLGSLYLARDYPSLVGGRKINSGAIDQFWSAVLMALFCCYILFPLFPSTPPRSFFHDFPGPALHPVFRRMNFWILGQYGIQSSVFPSGHVAGVTATALTVRRLLPRDGIMFLIAADSIAVATVYGRYHYAADAVAGAVIGVTAFFISDRLHNTQPISYDPR